MPILSGHPATWLLGGSGPIYPWSIPWDWPVPASMPDIPREAIFKLSAARIFYILMGYHPVFNQGKVPLKKQCKPWASTSTSTHATACGKQLPLGRCAIFGWSKGERKPVRKIRHRTLSLLREELHRRWICLRLHSRRAQQIERRKSQTLCCCPRSWQVSLMRTFLPPSPSRAW